MTEQELIAALKNQVAESATPTEGASPQVPYFAPLDGYGKLLELEKASQRKVQELDQAMAEQRRTHVRERTDDEFWGDMRSGYGMGSGAATRTISEAARVAGEIPVVPGLMGLPAQALNALRNQAYEAFGINKGLEESATAINEQGKDTTEYWQENLSEPREKARKLKDERIAEAAKEGFFPELVQSFKEGLSDPESLVEQIPNLAITALMARRGGAQMAVTGGAAMQGGDVAGQTREGLDKLDAAYFESLPEYQALIEQNVTPEEARQRITNQKVRDAYKFGAGSSLLLNAGLPGGSSIENILAGTVAKSATLKGAAKSIAKGTAGETFTEGNEEGIGQLATNEQIKSVNPAQPLYEGVGTAIGTGAAMGLQMGGSMNTLSGTGEYLGGKLEEAARSIAQADVEQAQIDAAIEVGDVSPFLNPESRSYDPVKGITAVYGINQKADTTPEQKVANETQVNEVLGTLEAQYEEVKARVAPYAPEQIAQTKALLTRDKQALEKLDPASTEAARLADLIELREEEIAEAENIDKDVLRNQEVQLARLERDLNKARKVKAQFSAQPEEDLEADLTQAATTVEDNDAPALEATQQAAQRVLSMSMSAVVEVTPERLLAVAENPVNGLSEDQRSYLRQVSEAKRLEDQAKGTKGVHQEILFGSKGGVKNGKRTSPMLGITDYRREIGSAVRIGDESTATRYLGLLTKFAQSHSSKAAAMKRAYEEMEETGESRQAVLIGNTWEVLSTLLPHSVVASNQGFTFSPASDASVQAGKRQMETTQLEANTLEATRAELQQAVALTFAQTQQTEATPVNSVDSGAAPAAVVESRPDQSTQEVQLQSNPDSTVDSAASELSTSTEAQDAPTSAELTEAPLTEDSASSTTEEAVSEDTLAEAPTSELAQTVEEDTTTVEEAPVEETVEESGKLDVFDKKIKSETPLTMQEKFDHPDFNLAAESFTQQTMSEAFASVKALVKVKNFLSNWLAGEVSPFDYLDLEREAATDEQRGALKHFAQVARIWLPKIKANFMRNPKPEQGFVYRDMMQYFYEDQADGSIDVEENIKTAIAYTAYRWIVDTANAPAFLKKEQIAEMHGMDKDARIPRKGQQALRGMHSFEETLITSLGEIAAQSLGLKALPDAPLDAMPRMKAALGAHAMALLEQEGVLQRKSMPLNTVRDLLGLPVDAELKRKEVKYILFTRDTGGEMHPKARQIRDANTSSGGIIDKLFAIEEAPRFAQTKPQTFRQKMTKNARQLITKMQRRVVQETMDIPHTVIPEMYKLFLLLGRENILEAAGYRANLDRVHKANRLSVEAQNRNLAQQHDLAFEMLHDPSNPNGVDSEFFVSQYVSRNYRAGFENQSLNMQTSKQHRVLFTRKGYKTTVDLTNEIDTTHYLVAVAGGMGIKIDQDYNDASVKKLLEKMKDPALQEKIDYLIETIIKGNEASWNNPTMAAEIARLAAQTEGMMTLQAMVSYAQYQAAVKAEKTSFETTLLVGVDGKTNGPMLTHLALGAANSLEALFKLLNRGGMYSTAEGQPNHFSQYYKDHQGLDLYQDLAKMILQRVKKTTPPELMAAMEVITKKLLEGEKVASAGRNMVKTPLTAFSFGSALKRSIEAMEDTFLEGIYATIEGLADGSRQDITRVDLIRSINKMFAEIGNVPLLDENLEIEALLETELSWRQEKAVREVFRSIMGKHVSDVMKSYFAVFIKRRSRLNKTINASFSLFDKLYQSARAKEIERLMDTGEVASRINKNGDRVPLHDLTQAQDTALREQLKKYWPVVHTDYSWREGNLGAGIFMAKSEAGISSDPMLASQVLLKSGKVNTGAVVRQETSPGVAGTAYLMHSSDSSGMHKAMDKVKGILNIHDDGSHSPTKVTEVAQALNEATVDTFLYYSPAREVLELLDRQVVTLAADIKQGKLDPKVLVPIFNAWANALSTYKNQVAPHEAGKLLMKGTFANALQADTLRLGAIAQMKVMDQYTWEGGQFEVSQQIRDTAQDMLEKLPQEPWSQATEAMTYLTELYTSQSTKATEENAQENEIDPVPKAESAEQLGVPGVMAGVVTQALQAKMPEVAEAVAQGTPIEDAINALEEDARVDAIQEVAQAAAQIPQVLQSPWGAIGKPVSAPNENMVRAFEETPVMSAQEALRLAYRELRTQGGPKNLNQFYQAMFIMLSKLVPTDVVVRYVTPDTPVDASLSGVQMNDKGWFAYTKKDGKVLKEIYILSADHAQSFVQPETLFHELIHAALGAVMQMEMDAFERNENSSREGVQLIKNLLELLNRAREAAKSKGLSDKYQAPLKDIHELVAYGLSNQAFQTEILNGIQMRQATAGNKLISGMRWFIDAVIGLLFRGSSRTERQQLNNGMGILIQNVAGLYALAQNTPNVYDLVLNDASFQMSASIASYSAEEIFNGLASPATPLTEQFEAHLRNVLNSVVRKIQEGKSSFSETTTSRSQGSPLDVWLKALNTGEAPFASQMSLSPFKVSEQERFVIEQVEATVRVALTDKTGTTTAAAAELRKLYKEAYHRLKVTDFERIAGNQSAQALYDFVFKMEKTQGDMTDHLSRFAAMGMAHEDFRKLLDMNTERDTRNLRDLSMTERIAALFERLLSWFNGKLTHTYAGQKADMKLSMLVDQLVSIESKRRLQLERKARAIEWLAPLEEKTKDLADAAKTKIEKVAGLPIVRASKIGVVRGASALTRTWAGDRVDQLGESMLKLRDKHLKQRHGMLTAMINEARGPKDVLQFLLRMTKLNERMRKQEIDRKAKEVLDSFKDNGKYLSPLMKAAISQVLVRTGAFSLLDRFDMTELQALVEDTAQRKQTIAQLEQELSAFPDIKHYFETQAKNLALFRVEGKAKSELLMLNARTIAGLYGTHQAGTLSDAQVKQAEEIIDLLVPLYAFEYANKGHRKQLAEVFRTEANRGEGINGLEFTLRLHKYLDAQSRERNFSGSEVLMTKGYVPEIYNPYVSIEAADEVAGRDLIDRGYKREGEALPKDPSDPDKTPMHLYVLHDGGMPPHVTGIVSYTGEVAKGTKMHNGFLSLVNEGGAANVRKQQKMQAGKQAGIEALFKPQPGYDPRKVPFTYEVPVLNSQGEVTNYRYMMQEATKDALLERDNRFEVLLGSLAGSIIDKETTTEQNTKVIKALKEIYDTEFKTRPDSFVHINHNAEDPEMREIYALLPKETRKVVKAVWGAQGMMVPYEMLDIVFGYRQLTMASIFDKKKEDREGVEKLVGDVVENLLYTYARFGKNMSVEDAQKYTRRAAVVVSRAENVWQALVKEVKDIIVVKSGVVLLGNITSNLSLLMAEGVPLWEGIRHHRVAFKGATTYMRDSARLDALKMQRETGYTQGNDAEIQREITALEDAIARNPVKELIDAGLMPTIVEDITLDDDIYSYKAAFTRKIEAVAENVNPGVLKVAKQAYMTHDTSMYQFLSRTTQLSDFVARYTLFQHLTTRKRNPLSREEAIQRASDAFVNYDIPMQRTLQYLDDHGLLMFTKYFLRIQRVLFRLAKEHPLQVLMMVATGQYLGGMPIVTDTLALTRIGNNPLDIGALNYPFSLDDLGTVQATLSLLK